MFCAIYFLNLLKAPNTGTKSTKKTTIELMTTNDYYRSDFEFISSEDELDTARHTGGEYVDCLESSTSDCCYSEDESLSFTYESVETSDGNESQSEASVLFVDEITYFSDLSETPTDSDRVLNNSSSSLDFFTEVFARDSASKGSICLNGSATKSAIESAEQSSLECFDLEIVIDRRVESDHDYEFETLVESSKSENDDFKLQEREAQNVFDQNNFANDFHISQLSYGGVKESKKVDLSSRSGNTKDLSSNKENICSKRRLSSRVPSAAVYVFKFLLNIASFLLKISFYTGVMTSSSILCNKCINILCQSQKDSFPDVKNVFSYMSNFSDESVGKLGAIFAISNIVLQKTISTALKCCNCATTTTTTTTATALTKDSRDSQTLKGFLLCAFSVFTMFSYFASVDLINSPNSTLVWPVFNIALSVVFGGGNYLSEAILYYSWVFISTNKHFESTSLINASFEYWETWCNKLNFHFGLFFVFAKLSKYVCERIDL